MRGFLPLYRDAVDIFYSPNQLGQNAPRSNGCEVVLYTSHIYGSGDLPFDALHAQDNPFWGGGDLLPLQRIHSVHSKPHQQELVRLVNFYHYHHHVVPLAQISLTLSRHFSLSFITSGRSSGPHPVSSYSCCMYVCSSWSYCISSAICGSP